MSEQTEAAEKEQHAIEVLGYHATLLHLVQETERYAVLLEQLSAMSKRIDPLGDRPDQPEEEAAIRAVAQRLHSACEACPGIADVFAFAAAKTVSVPA